MTTPYVPRHHEPPPGWPPDVFRTVAAALADALWATWLRSQDLAPDGDAPAGAVADGTPARPPGRRARREARAR